MARSARFAKKSLISSALSSPARSRAALLGRSHNRMPQPREFHKVVVYKGWGIHCELLQKVCGVGHVLNTPLGQPATCLGSLSHLD